MKSGLEKITLLGDINNFFVKVCWQHTAIPYRASTGPDQGFPCVVFPHREKPVFISWDLCNENRVFSQRKTIHRENPVFITGMGLQSTQQCFAFHLKQTFLTVIWIFTEGAGDGIESRYLFYFYYGSWNSKTGCTLSFVSKVFVFGTCIQKG